MGLKVKKIILLGLFVGLVGCGDNSYDKCVENGISYFKEIEAFPKLSNGEDATEVAKERCHRSRVAFGSVD